MPVLTNIRHELFAQGIAKGMEVIEAYKQAGYTPHSGNASRLIGDENVASRIRDLIESGAALTTITVARILDEISAIAVVDPGDAFEWGSTKRTVKIGRGRSTKTQEIYVPFLIVKDSKSLPERVRRAVAKVRKTKDGLGVEFHPKLRALEILGRHLGIFKDAEKAIGKTHADLVLESIKIVGHGTGDAAKTIDGDEAV